MRSTPSSGARAAAALGGADGGRREGGVNLLHHHARALVHQTEIEAAAKHICYVFHGDSKVRSAVEIEDAATVLVGLVASGVVWLGRMSEL